MEWNRFYVAIPRIPLTAQGSAFRAAGFKRWSSKYQSNQTLRNKQLKIRAKKKTYPLTLCDQLTFISLVRRCLGTMTGGMTNHVSAKPMQTISAADLSNMHHKYTRKELI